MARTSPADRGVPYFPAFLDLLGKKVVVVGGGRVATTKVRALLACRPQPLWVIAPRASTFIRDAASTGALVWLQREYARADLADAALAFGATDERAENARVAADARRLGIPVLAIDDVPNCDFIAPALVRRGDLTIAISTGGRSPAMARRTREHLELALPASWANLLEVAASAREKLGSTRALIDAERWQTALDGDVECLAEAGALQAATELLLHRLESSLFETADEHSGLVSLVGARAGEADLLTVRALRRLQAADAVVHYRLVSVEVLALARPDAERFEVGTASSGVGSTQADINRLLVSLGQAGKRVVRLLGGDPFVFGRTGEEALALARAGVAWELVPGVSPAPASPMAAGRLRTEVVGPPGQLVSGARRL
jgi:siroheme synthase-like protein